MGTPRVFMGSSASVLPSGTVLRLASFAAEHTNPKTFPWTQPDCRCSGGILKICAGWITTRRFASVRPPPKQTHRYSIPGAEDTEVRGPIPKVVAFDCNAASKN